MSFHLFIAFLQSKATTIMIKLDKFIQGINNKDPRAWKELYRFYYGALCNYSSSIINETSVAEDIVQECLIMIWKSDLNFQNIKILSSYLYKSVYNNTLKYIRDKKVEDKRKSEWSSTLSETEDDIFYMAAEEDVIRKLRAALALLPDQRKTILQLSLEGYSVQEIALQLEISINTVKTQKKRAYSFLKENLKQYFSLLLLLGILK